MVKIKFNCSGNFVSPLSIPVPWALQPDSLAVEITHKATELCYIRTYIDQETLKRSFYLRATSSRAKK